MSREDWFCLAVGLGGLAWLLAGCSAAKPPAAPTQPSRPPWLTETGFISCSLWAEERPEEAEASREKVKGLAGEGSLEELNKLAQSLPEGGINSLRYPLQVLQLTSKGDLVTYREGLRLLFGGCQVGLERALTKQTLSPSAPPAVKP